MNDSDKIDKALDLISFDPRCPDENLMEAKLVNRELIIQLIEECELNIPYDPNTFGLYCLCSAY